MPGDLIIRAPGTDAELNAFFELATRAFISETDAERHASGWRQYVATAPDAGGYHLRGAYRGEEYLGGYLIHERELCVGMARLRTACIAAVVTRPEYRGQGIGAAMMRDAVSFAYERCFALLLLGGIPDFYHRFGFVHVLDIAEHVVDRKRILAAATAFPNESTGTLSDPTDQRLTNGATSTGCTVRPAALEDSPGMLALYWEAFGRYRGSFDWTVEQYEHKLCLRLAEEPPLLAVSGTGSLCGYYIHPWTQDDVYTAELVVPQWPAALALLRHLAAQPGSGDELRFPLPPDSSTYYCIADRLLIRTTIQSHPNAGWMARPAHLPTLMASLLPELQSSWEQCGIDWSGPVDFRVEDETFSLRIDSGEVRIEPSSGTQEAGVRLSAPVFTQLLFGYRPAWWLAQQPGQELPDGWELVLEALFPRKPAWIAGSDAF